jgi:WD40 repeat protein
MKKIFQVLLFLTPLSIWAQKPVLTVQNGHQSVIANAAMSVDNAYIISVDFSGTAILWDVVKSKQIRSFQNVLAAEFAADSRSIYLALKKGKFQQIDLNGKKLNNWVLDKSDIGIATESQYTFLPESGIFLSREELQNFKTGKIQYINDSNSSSFSRIKNWICTGTDNTVSILDANDGHSIKKIAVPIDADGYYNLYVTFSKDGNLLLARRASVYRIIDANTGKILQTLKHDDESIMCATFSADGKKAIIGGVNNFYIWNVQTGALIKKVAHEDWSKNYKIEQSNFDEIFKLSADGQKILHAGGGESAMKIDIFNAETLAFEKKFDNIFNGAVETMFLSDDSKTLSVKKDSTLLVHWDLTTGKSEKPVKVPNVPLLSSIDINQKSAVSPDAKTYLTSNYITHTIDMTDAFTGKTLNHFSLDNADFEGGFFPIVISADQKYVMAIPDHSDLCVWEYQSRKLILKLDQRKNTLVMGNKSNIAAIAAVTDNKPMVQIVEVPSGKLLAEFESKSTDYTGEKLAFSNNDKIIAIPVENKSKAPETIQLFDYNTKKIQAICTIPSGYIGKFTFSPDDKHFLVGTSEGTIYTFNAANGQLESTINAHAENVRAIKFLKNGKFFFTDGDDNLIKVWSFKTKELVATLYNLNDAGDWAVTCPDGRFDATNDAMKSMCFVSDLAVTPLESLYEKFYTPNLLPRILNDEKFDPVPVDINTLKAAPTVKILLENQQRNLVVDDDVPTYSLDREQVTLKIQADCPSDVVTEIRLFQNGKLVQSTRNLVVEDENTEGVKSMTKTFTVALSDGENRFKTIAFNSERTESPADEIIVNYKPQKSSNTEGGVSTVNLYLVVIGINKYKNPRHNLNYATADATSFKEAIEKGGSSIFSNTNVVFLGDAQATKEGITTELNKIKATATAKDVFIFYYAGHGVMNEKKAFYLVPHDVIQMYGQDDALAQKGLSSNELQQFSKEIKAQKQLFILDACQSAGALETLVAIRGAAEEKAIAQLARATGTHWLTASGSEQNAAEFPQLGHGTFTYVLLEALSGKADKGGDKKVTVKELDAYLQERVPEVTTKYRGAPQYPSSYGYGNDFPIGVVKN